MDLLSIFFTKNLSYFFLSFVEAISTIITFTNPKIQTPRSIDHMIIIIVSAVFIDVINPTILKTIKNRIQKSIKSFSFLFIIYYPHFASKEYLYLYHIYRLLTEFHYTKIFFLLRFHHIHFADLIILIFFLANIYF